MKTNITKAQHKALAQLAETPNGSSYCYGRAGRTYGARLATWCVLRDAGLVTIDTRDAIHNGSVATITSEGRAVLRGSVDTHWADEAKKEGA